MAPRIPENTTETITPVVNDEKIKQPSEYKLQIVWRNVILFVFLHIGAAYGFKLMLFNAKWQTGVFGKYNYSFLVMNYSFL